MPSRLPDLHRATRPRPHAARRPRARRSLLVLLGVTLALAALPSLGIAIDRAQRPPAIVPAPPRPHAPSPSLMSALPAVRDRERPTLFVVMRDADCLAWLDLLALLDRPALSSGIARGGVLLLGADSTARTLRATLAAHRLDHPVRLAPATLEPALATVTRGPTPLVLVTAPDGSLRYLAPAPIGPDADDRLVRDLATLATTPPTPSTAGAHP